MVGAVRDFMTKQPAKAKAKLPPFVSASIVAEALGLSEYVVRRLFDSDELKGYVFKGTKRQERRISRESVIRYMAKNHIPMSSMPGLVCMIIAHAVPHDFMRQVLRRVPSEPGVRCLFTDNLFDLGGLVEYHRPSLILVDAAESRDDAILVREKLANVDAIAMTAEDDTGRALIDAGYNEVIQRPAKPDRVAKSLRQWLGV